jgi:HNH endonuclease
MLQSLASLECFIQKLKQNGGLIGVDLISQDPKITYTKNKTTIELYLKDTPRLRQEYYNYQCFRES